MASNTHCLRSTTRKRTSSRTHIFAVLIALGLINTVSITGCSNQDSTSRSEADNGKLNEKSTSVSDQLVWLESDSPARTKWIHERNAELNAEIRKFTNKLHIEDWLRGSLDREVSLQMQKLEIGPLAGKTLMLIDRGLGKPTELITQQHDGTQTTLYSNFNLKKNNSYTFLNFLVSPQETTLIASFAPKGSINDYVLVLIDLASGQVLRDDISAVETSALFLKNDQLAIQTKIAKVSYITLISVADPKTEVQVEGYITPLENGWGVIYFTSKQQETFIDQKGENLTETDESPQSIAGSDDTSIFFTTRGPSGFGTIRKVKIQKANDPRRLSELLVPERAEMLLSAAVNTDAIFADYQLGAARFVDILDLNGGLLARIPIPNCCSGIASGWHAPGQIVSFTLSSIASSHEFLYDINQKTWLYHADSTVAPRVVTAIEIESIMLSTKQGKIVSEILEVTSLDGITKFPMRVTRLENLVQDQSHPVLMEAYGGFGLSGYINPRRNIRYVEFLSRGGIYAAPAVRGSNELGPDWHKQAMRKNKRNTMLDLVASARLLVAKGWTKPQLTVIRGGSNGGLTVASSGLQFPNDFGLVIPIAGVNDLLKKEVLNPEFNQGWSNEYGDSRTPEYHDFLASISPVELAAIPQKIPKFLVISGINDTRVNPIHSYKLVEALRIYHPDQLDQIRSFSLKNSGHWMSSPSYQDYIGWRVDAVMWMEIFNLAGWAF